MITPEELYYKSIEQQVTHRKTWEQISQERKYQFEAFAYWANELSQEIINENNRLKRDNGRLQNRLENAEDAVKNLVEKIEQLENLQVYEGLDAEILETSE